MPEASKDTKCHSCERTFRVGDARIKYGIEDKLSVLKQYLEGVGIRSIERITGIPSPLIVRWIRHASQMLKQELSKSPIPEDVKAIEILEVDELFNILSKKSQKAYVWLAVDRNRNKIIDIAVSKYRDKWVFVRMCKRLKCKGYQVNILCTDGYEGYGYYKLANRHVISKAETSLRRIQKLVNTLILSALP